MITAQFPWLTAIVLLPLVASLFIPMLPEKYGKYVRWYALGVAIADFILMCYAFWNHYDANSATFQLMEKYAWIPQLGLNWTVSVDGLSVPLVLLAGLVRRFPKNKLPLSWSDEDIPFGQERITFQSSLDYTHCFFG